MSKITGIIRNHIRFCVDENCQCRESLIITEDILQDSESIKIIKNERKDLQSDKSKSIEEMVCEILNSILKKLKETNNLGERVIINAYIDYFMINRIYTSLYNLMLAEEYSLSYYQEFQLFCLRKIIEFRMIEEERRNATSAKENFSKVVTSHKKYMAFHDLTYQTIKLYCHYWSEFLKTRLGILIYRYRIKHIS